MPPATPPNKTINDFFVVEAAMLGGENTQQLVQPFECDQADGYFGAEDLGGAVVSDDFPRCAGRRSRFSRTPIHHGAPRFRSEAYVEGNGRPDRW